MVYLDYNATTPLAREALDAMLPYLCGNFGNPSSIHAAGRRARAAIDEARERLASLLAVRPHELVFTSGGTESNNLAILGLARRHRARGRHLVVSPTEHHAVLHAFQALRDREGFDLTVLPIGQDGQIDPDTVREALRNDTVLAAVMSANNETGTKQPVAEIARICRERNVLFHCDMVQSFGKEPVRPHAVFADTAALAAHKFGGPKGAGLLFVRSGISLEAIHHGGSHENQRRPGTENVAAIAGMAAAAEIAATGIEAEQERQRALRDRLWEKIRAIRPDAVRNSHPTDCLSNTLNVSFPGADGESLLIGLDIEGVCASSGSACMVGSTTTSHVLVAMGLPVALAQATVRFSIGKQTSLSDIEYAGVALERVLARQHQFTALPA